MKRYLALVTNDRGSALLVLVLLIPVMTLFCIYAANVSNQNENVVANDNCHRDALYNSDGAVYGTAKLISDIFKTNDERDKVEEGSGKAAPGIQYLNSESDKAKEFVQLLDSKRANDTDKDLEFVKTDSVNDFGIESTVDLTKMGGGVLAGGGAEFGNSAEGVGSQLNVVVFRLSSIGKAKCPNTNVTVVGDYWMITNKEVQKGI